MFETPLLLMPIGNRLWRVQAPFIATTKTAGRIEVPAGFVTDLTSIPRILWVASTPADWPEAAVLHDWGYRDAHLPKDVADRVYREVMETLKASGVRVRLRYWALKWFGRYPSKEPVYTVAAP
jgi:hypothetical protein